MLNIKQVIKQSGLKQYEIADYLGIKESNFSRDLRYPISQEYERKILLAIREMQMKKEVCSKWEHWKQRTKKLF